jgi:hypothetical protein
VPDNTDNPQDENSKFRELLRQCCPEESLFEGGRERNVEESDERLLDPTDDRTERGERAHGERQPQHAPERAGRERQKQGRGEARRGEGSQEDQDAFEEFHG